AVQRLAFEQLHRQVADVGGLADLVDGDDVVAAHLGQRPGLPEEPLAVRRGLADLRTDDLQGDGPLEVGVLGEQDDAHATRAKDLEDAVMGEPPEFVASEWGRKEGQRDGRRVAGLVYTGVKSLRDVHGRSCPARNGPAPREGSVLDPSRNQFW